MVLESQAMLLINFYVKLNQSNDVISFCCNRPHRILAKTIGEWSVHILDVQLNANLNL